MKNQAEEEGLHLVFIEAGFEWREPGCSMCLAMNDDIFNMVKMLRLVIEILKVNEKGGRTHLVVLSWQLLPQLWDTLQIHELFN